MAQLSEAGINPFLLFGNSCTEPSRFSRANPASEAAVGENPPGNMGLVAALKNTLEDIKSWETYFA